MELKGDCEIHWFRTEAVSNGGSMTPNFLAAGTTRVPKDLDFD